MIDQHPTEDFYFAGVVALTAYRIREFYPALVCEALMREIALQLDPAVGRSDSTISNVAFTILGRVRKAREAERFCDHDQAVETILERMGIPQHAIARSIVTSLATRQKLAEPLALAAPTWWDAFTGLYLVDVSTLRAMPRRASVVGPYGLGVERLRGIQRAHPGARRQAARFSFAAWLSKACAANPQSEQRLASRSRSCLIAPGTFNRARSRPFQTQVSVSAVVKYRTYQ